MDANIITTITAVCSIVTAVAALSVSVYQARATRIHNRHSVRPILKLSASFHRGDTAGGLRLTNVGLGPAAITKTILTFDGNQLGEFSESNVNVVREAMSKFPSHRPSAKTLGSGGIRFLSKDYDEYILSVQTQGGNGGPPIPYDSKDHEAFCDLVRRRIQLEIHYESLYGGENFKVIHRQRVIPTEQDDV
jgi:hypothetical protein